MKSVLLVSPYPYTSSNRGMDLLTRAFEASGWDTDHLQFPQVVYSVLKKTYFPSTVNEKKSKLILIPYIDRIMKKIPCCIFNWIVRNHWRSVTDIVWNSYDVIVLESGKPLFLLDILEEGTELIYRQSDPVRLFLGENPHYIAMEDEIFKRSNYILIPKDRFKDTIPTEYHHKISMIPNGLRIPDNTDLDSPFPKDSINAVYVGLAPLDTETLNITVNQNPGITFHLFGTGVRGISAVVLKRKKKCYYPSIFIAELFPALSGQCRDVYISVSAFEEDESCWSYFEVLYGNVFRSSHCELSDGTPGRV